MQLSTRGRYAVMAMTDLAQRAALGAALGATGGESAKAVTVAGIAERQQISHAYLEQIFARLRRAGLVRSVRGPGGGYQLSRAAEAVSVADVIAAVDEPLKATRCGGGETGCMHGGARCLTHDLWEETGRAIHDYLASVSLADVLAGRLRPEPARAA